VAIRSRQSPVDSHSTIESIRDSAQNLNDSTLVQHWLCHTLILVTPEFKCLARLPFPEDSRLASNVSWFTRRARIKRPEAPASARPVSMAYKANALRNTASVVPLWLIPRNNSQVFRDNSPYCGSGIIRWKTGPPFRSFSTLAFS